MNLKTNQKGFTIVELLIVIVVIAILAAISIVAFTGVQERARNSSAFSLASQVAKKADVYYALNGSYPTEAAHFAGEAALEGAKVTIRTGTPVSGTIASSAFGSTSPANTNSLNQFNSGNRVIYHGASNGYVVTYLEDSSSDFISKGTTPSGTPTHVSNENL